jgi:hypothetical protein
MPLPTGSWELVADGVEGKLSIEFVDEEGHVRGEIDGWKFFGFWNEAMQRLTFMSISDDVMQHQAYTGFHFIVRSDDPSSNSTHMLTGYYQAFGGRAATAERHVFGWFAQVRRPI